MKFKKRQSTDTNDLIECKNDQRINVEIVGQNKCLEPKTV